MRGMLKKAVEAAKKAFPFWSQLSKQERHDHLMRLADGIAARFDELSQAESLDNGKPEWLCQQVDIPRASENFRFFATASLHFASQLHDMDGQAINYTLRQPIGGGVHLTMEFALVSFNLENCSGIGRRKYSSGKTIRSNALHGLSFKRNLSGDRFPSGVLNIVHGYGQKVGEAISAHPDTPVISFTGGTVTGSKIAQVAAPMFKKLSLELGGKNPTIVFSDADQEKALDMAIKASFRNQGQICLCGSRLFVEASIYESFKAKFVERAKQLKVGNPKRRMT